MNHKNPVSGTGDGVSYLDIIKKHANCTDGCFCGNGSFKACPTPNPKDLEDLFRYEVFKMFKTEGKINDVVIKNMMIWHHSGFTSQLVLTAMYSNI